MIFAARTVPRGRPIFSPFYSVKWRKMAVGRFAQGRKGSCSHFFSILQYKMEKKWPSAVQNKMSQKWAPNEGSFWVPGKMSSNWRGRWLKATSPLSEMAGLGPEVAQTQDLSAPPSIPALVPKTFLRHSSKLRSSGSFGWTQSRGHGAPGKNGHFIPGTISFISAEYRKSISISCGHFFLILAILGYASVSIIRTS